ncbi:hypothetical protein V5799_019532 [Amblyomma americanum]|uniref:Uncharacterized protein n=1 Tax=Amblyomma americanum TaxID=6943 RepID=A0AAQ4EW84_AMBAM
MPEEFEYGQWATVSDVSECSHVVRKTDKVKALNALGKSASSVGVLSPKETKRGTFSFVRRLHGSQASIVPGALQGYEILHKDLGGKFSWEQLFAPAINLANNGFPIKKHFADILKSHESEIASSAELQ